MMVGAKGLFAMNKLGVSLTACGVLLFACLCLALGWQSEKTSHVQTKAQLGQCAVSNTLLLSDQRRANATIEAIQEQVSANLNACDEYISQEQRAKQILNNAKPQTRPAQSELMGVVDDETRQQMVDLLNNW